MPKLIENVREKLILEGRKTLIEKSYKELNIRDISKNCSIAIGTFYNYFKNKEELVSAVFRDDWIKTLNLVDELKDKDLDFREKLKLIYFSLETFVDRYIPIFYEIASIKGYKGKEENEYHDFYEKMEDFIKTEISKGNIYPSLPVNKFSSFIVSNLMSLSRSKYMTIDELFQVIKL